MKLANSLIVILVFTFLELYNNKISEASLSFIPKMLEISLIFLLFKTLSLSVKLDKSSILVLISSVIKLLNFSLLYFRHFWLW